MTGTQQQLRIAPDGSNRSDRRIAIASRARQITSDTCWLGDNSSKRGRLLTIRNNSGPAHAFEVNLTAGSQRSKRTQVVRRLQLSIPETPGFLALSTCSAGHHRGEAFLWRGFRSPVPVPVPVYQRARVCPMGPRVAARWLSCCHVKGT